MLAGLDTAVIPWGEVASPLLNGTCNIPGALRFYWHVKKRQFHVCDDVEVVFAFFPCTLETCFLLEHANYVHLHMHVV